MSQDTDLKIGAVVECICGAGIEWSGEYWHHSGESSYHRGRNGEGSAWCYPDEDRSNLGRATPL
jgi:hypothetical protein